MTTARVPTLADLAFPNATRLHDVVLVFAVSLFTGLMAQLAVFVPWSPVPITGQTFAVLLSGAVLGARRGFMAQVVYLAQGLVLPVFAAGTFGVLKFVGPTGGYLLSFPLAAALVGALCQRGWDRRFPTMLIAMVLGSAVILAMGAISLGRFVPADYVVTAGVVPFAIGDVIKAVLAAGAFPIAWRFLGRTGRPS